MWERRHLRGFMTGLSKDVVGFGVLLVCLIASLGKSMILDVMDGKESCVIIKAKKDDTIHGNFEVGRVWSKQQYWSSAMIHTCWGEFRGCYTTKSIGNTTNRRYNHSDNTHEFSGTHRSTEQGSTATLVYFYTSTPCHKSSIRAFEASSRFVLSLYQWSHTLHKRYMGCEVHLYLITRF